MTIYILTKIGTADLINEKIKMPSLQHEIRDILRLVDENLEDINEFKEISHNIDLAFEIIAKRIEKIEKDIEELQYKIIDKGFTRLEAKIMRIIKDETRKFHESLIDYSSPVQEIKKSANIPRDNNTNTEDEASN